MRLFLALAFFTALLVSACSHHHYGYYEPPRAYNHEHRLHCGHYVSCRYSRGAHHFRPHQTHHEYYHQHRVRQFYVPCHVVRGRHYY